MTITEQVEALAARDARIEELEEKLSHLTNSVAGSFDDGGPAFPRSPAVARGGVIPGESGMSLWDYYAAASLTGLEANPKIDWLAEDYAATASDHADAMVAEKRRREKGAPPVRVDDGKTVCPVCRQFPGYDPVRQIWFCQNVACPNLTFKDTPKGAFPK